MVGGGINRREVPTSQPIASEEQTQEHGEALAMVDDRASEDDQEPRKVEGPRAPAIRPMWRMILWIIWFLIESHTP
ncbi:hypothetical protein Aple_092010 [Acrocarpospora pleiomorpha]|uniref:Uncharacterized protein n=1 Tax=Acrocarpospora pleiomorpha TaxID=90975 RepID=A0A5M3XZ31_9ACTN|nr:hypothetical protein Aple_092010 [Acrocarpospora pleiomorpha]